jgi:protein subunit release factor A
MKKIQPIETVIDKNDRDLFREVQQLQEEKKVFETSLKTARIIKDWAAVKTINEKIRSINQKIWKINTSAEYQTEKQGVQSLKAERHDLIKLITNDVHFLSMEQLRELAETIKNNASK